MATNGIKSIKKQYEISYSHVCSGVKLTERLFVCFSIYQSNNLFGFSLIRNFLSPVTSPLIQRNYFLHDCTWSLYQMHLLDQGDAARHKLFFFFLARKWKPLRVLHITTEDFKIQASAFIMQFFSMLSKWISSDLFSNHVWLSERYPGPCHVLSRGCYDPNHREAKWSKIICRFLGCMEQNTCKLKRLKERLLPLKSCNKH